MAQVVLIGYSGHAFVVTDIIHDMGHSAIGYFDIEKKINNPYSLEYLGNESDPDDLRKVLNREIIFALGLGQNPLRTKAFEFLSQSGYNILTGLHSSSTVSPTATVGEGSMVMPRAIINAIATVGKACIINSGATVEHECVINDFVHVGPSATLAGNVHIGNGTFIGANATIRQGLKIGKNVVVGAGAVVLKDIPDNETWAGVPAHKLSR